MTTFSRRVTLWQRQLKQHQLIVALKSHGHQVIRQPQSQFQSQYQQCYQQIDPAENRILHSTPKMRITEFALRRSILPENLKSKKQVEKMFFVLVLAFLMC